MSRGYVPAHAAPPQHSRLHRVMVDLWYLPCVLVPLIASMTAPAWYLRLFDPRPHTTRGTGSPYACSVSPVRPEPS